MTQRWQDDATRQARSARDVLPVEWLVLLIVVVLVVAVGFGLRYLVA